MTMASLLLPIGGSNVTTANGDGFFSAKKEVLLLKLDACSISFTGTVFRLFRPSFMVAA